MTRCRISLIRHQKRTFLSWNADVGRDADENWHSICRPFCNDETNERGLKLLEFATFNDLVLANAFGHNKASRRWTWQCPNGQHHNQIDYILVRKCFWSGCPQYFLNKLQQVQNNAARLVLRVSKRDHISPHLASLHWLSIDSWIQYKLSSLYYNCLNSTAPDYLTELLRIYKPTRQLRSSSDTSILCIPTVCTHSLGQRSFSHAAPAVWNTHPYEIRSSNTISSFKSSLKTYLFQQSYWLCMYVGGRQREEREREEGERQREREGVRERTSGLSQSVRFFPPLISCNGPCAPKEK